MTTRVLRQMSRKAYLLSVQDCAPNMGVAQSVSQTVHYDDGSGSAVAVATGAKKGIQTTADGEFHWLYLIKIMSFILSRVVS